METIVRARNINKRYGDVIALDNVDLDIQTGKIVGLIGPNGAGKTTLLKCLLGLASCGGEIKVLVSIPSGTGRDCCRKSVLSPIPPYCHAG